MRTYVSAPFRHHDKVSLEIESEVREMVEGVAIIGTGQWVFALAVGAARAAELPYL